MIILAIYIFGGSIYYRYEEGWTFSYSLYFCVVVATTVGYGDQPSITSNHSMIFTALWAFFGVALVLGVVFFLVTNIAEGRKRRKLKR